MSGALAIFANWWLHLALGGGLLLLFAWALMRCCRQPARQQRFGEVGLSAALLLGVLSLGPAWVVLPLLPEESLPQSAVHTHSSLPPVNRPLVSHQEVAALPLQPDEGPANEPDQSEGALPENDQGGLPSWRWGQEAADATSTQAEFSGKLDQAESHPTEIRSHGAAEAGLPHASVDIAQLVNWLGLAYAVVTTILLGRWLLGQYGLWRILRTARPAPGPIDQLFRRMARGHQRPPRLLVSGRLRLPLSCGLWRPTVVVPASLCAPRRAQMLRWIFAHELTHLERRDSWACVLFGLGQVLYFYLPWFWWLRRQVRLCQEYIADAAAAEHVGRPEDYAQFLLSLTPAAAVPLGATGVMGNSSDLFRRVTMLLQTSVRVEKHCPRWWSLAAAGSLLALAVLVSGVGLRADTSAASTATSGAAIGSVPDPDDANPAPKKDELLKKDQPKPPAGLAVPQGNPARPEQLKELMKVREEMIQRMLIEGQLAGQALPPQRQRFNVDAGGQFGPGGFGWQHHARLGVRLQKPGATLADQLDLPKGQGMVIEDVQKDSAAAKAGLKTHDILLELAGKPVPDDGQKLLKMVDDIKADTPVDAVVLRKGKKETIKGISLPEAKAVQQPLNKFGGPGFGGGGFGGRPGFPGGPPGGFGGGGLPGFPQQQGAPMLQPMMPGQGTAEKGVLTTNFRAGDRFTLRHEEGSLIITVTGKVADGKTKINQIKIQDGREAKSYEGVDDVPEQYQDKVKNLIDINEKSSTKIEIKTAPEKKKNPKQE